MTKSITCRLRELFAVCATAALLAPASAWPCGSRMMYERIHRPADTEVLRVAQVDLKAGRDLAALAGARKLLSRERASANSLEDLFGFGEGQPPKPTAANLKWARRVAGVALLRLGRYDEALMHLERSAREFKGEPYVRAKLAQAQLGSGKPAEGRANLEALDSEGLLPDADSKVALARARFAEDDRDGALAAVKAALAQDPRHGQALLLRAKLAPRPDPLAGATAGIAR
ncbi:MAG: tetratricopeptide repeat protein [Myxococcaceae bacterium]